MAAEIGPPSIEDRKSPLSFARAGGAILEIHAFPDHDPRGRVVQVLGRLQLATDSKGNLYLTGIGSADFPHTPECPLATQLRTLLKKSFDRRKRLSHRSVTV
jgi:hypothetical protein